MWSNLIANILFNHGGWGSMAELVSGSRLYFPIVCLCVHTFFLSGFEAQNQHSLSLSPALSGPVCLAPLSLPNFCPAGGKLTSSGSLPEGSLLAFSVTPGAWGMLLLLAPWQMVKAFFSHSYHECECLVTRAITRLLTWGNVGASELQERKRLGHSLLPFTCTVQSGSG